MVYPDEPADEILAERSAPEGNVVTARLGGKTLIYLNGRVAAEYPFAP